MLKLYILKAARLCDMALKFLPPSPPSYVTRSPGKDEEFARFLRSYHKQSYILHSKNVKTTRIIHHNQLQFTKFGTNLRHIESMTSKVQPAADSWTDDVKMTSKCFFLEKGLHHPTNHLFDWIFLLRFLDFWRNWLSSSHLDSTSKYHSLLLENKNNCAFFLADVWKLRGWSDVSATPNFVKYKFLP